MFSWRWLTKHALGACLTTRGKGTERIGVPTVGSQACHLKLEVGRRPVVFRKKLVLALPVLKESVLRWLERGRPLGTAWSLCGEALDKASSIVSSEWLVLPGRMLMLVFSLREPWPSFTAAP